MLSTCDKHVVYLVNCVNFQEFFSYYHLHLCYFAVGLEFVSSVAGEMALDEEYTRNSTCVYICLGYNSDTNSG